MLGWVYGGARRPVDLVAYVLQEDDDDVGPTTTTTTTTTATNDGVRAPTRSAKEASTCTHGETASARGRRSDDVGLLARSLSSPPVSHRVAVGRGIVRNPWSGWQSPRGLLGRCSGSMISRSRDESFGMSVCLCTTSRNCRHHHHRFFFFSFFQAPSARAP
jgi:hypothetical protein